MSLFDHKITELKQMIHKKEIKISDLVDESYKRIASVDDKVQAFLQLDEERARAYAKELDEAVDGRSEHGLLFGMPIGVKDNIVTKGFAQHAQAKSSKTSIRFTMRRSWSAFKLLKP